MARIHDRMPVMLQEDEVDSWLNPALSDPEHLTGLLKAPPEDYLECYPVEKSLLNSPLIDTPEWAENTGVDYAPLLRSGS
jgi:putative SOS response-associated peptidase YedK